MTQSRLLSLFPCTTLPCFLISPRTPFFLPLTCELSSPPLYLACHWAGMASDALGPMSSRVDAQDPEGPKLSSTAEMLPECHHACRFLGHICIFVTLQSTSVVTSSTLVSPCLSTDESESGCKSPHAEPHRHRTGPVTGWRVLMV